MYFRNRGLRVEKQIGSGAFGDVFLVVDKCGTPFVVKRINSCGRGDVDVQARAERNAQRMTSDHIVRTLDAWREPGDGRLCLLLEYCNGGDMTAAMRRDFPFSESTLVAMFVQLLLALDHLHMRHVLHRDVKLDNVLVCEGVTGASVPTVKLSDFGVSKAVHHTDALAGTRLGTPLYLSPELLTGHRYSRKTDVWSLGVVFYNMMTNQMPFPVPDIVSLTRAVLQDTPPHPSDAGRALYSTALGDLVMQMLNKSRSSRASPRELLALPVFEGIFTTWPWKAVPLRSCVGVFVCRRRVSVNIRTAPSLEAEKVGELRYGDQLYVQRGVVSTETAEGGQLAWFRVMFPLDGFCVVGHGSEPFFQLFQDPRPASALSASCSVVDEGDSITHVSQSRSTCVGVSSERVDLSMISSLFTSIPS